MATDKKSTTSEDMYDLLNDPDFLNDSPKSKKEKRQLVKIKKEFDDLPKVNATPAKKLKVNEGIGDAGEMRQRTLNVFNQQLQASKQIDDNLLKSIDKVIADIEADYDVLDDNVQKLEQRSGLLLKCMHQTSAAHKEKLESIDAIYSAYKKQTEGLILRGALKPDDRPLWFDVYKAFPPATEPKFARPKPENQSIRPILYKEDVIRAKFHAKGHGLSVNMLSSTGETQTRKLIQKYQQLQSEGVAEEELLQKSVEAIGSARQAAAETSTMTPKNPDSVTAKVFAEADLKNIFKE